MPTIVATNLTDEQIKSPLYYGPALWRFSNMRRAYLPRPKLE